MIKMEVIARLGKDAIVVEVGGRKVANFNVATSKTFTDKQGVKREVTTWISCAYWDDNMKVAQYLRKGTQVYLSGEPYTKLYQPQDGGEPQAQLNLTVHYLQLIGNQSQSTENTSERRLATEGSHYSQHPYSNPNRQSTGAGTISNDQNRF